MPYALGLVQVSVAPFLLAILGTFTLTLLVLAGVTLLDSTAETWPVRAAQRLRLRGTRMFRMLKRRHVDVAGYARSLAAAELKQQLDTCGRCGLASLCDRACRSRAPSRSVFSFCPNRPAIEQYLVSRTPLSV